MRVNLATIQSEIASILISTCLQHGSGITSMRVSLGGVNYIPMRLHVIKRGETFLLLVHYNMQASVFD